MITPEADGYVTIHPPMPSPPIETESDAVELRDGEVMVVYGDRGLRTGLAFNLWKPHSA